MSVVVPDNVQAEDRVIIRNVVAAIEDLKAQGLKDPSVVNGRRHRAHL